MVIQDVIYKCFLLLSSPNSPPFAFVIMSCGTVFKERVLSDKPLHSRNNHFALLNTHTSVKVKLHVRLNQLRRKRRSVERRAIIYALARENVIKHETGTILPLSASTII